MASEIVSKHLELTDESKDDGPTKEASMDKNDKVPKPSIISDRSFQPPNLGLFMCNLCIHLANHNPV
jgi:hypothetical protein